MRLSIIVIWALAAAAMLIVGCTEEETAPPPVGGVEYAFVEPEDERDSVLLEMEGTDSLTVFGLLEKALTVRHMSSVQGAFVTHIDGIGGPDEHFWLYSVNDEFQKVAADRYTPEEGDVIRWHYRYRGGKE